MKKILIVDGQALLLDGLKRALKTEATEITIMESGNSALSAMHSSFYDFCFIDINLSDTSGLELLMRMKHVSPTTKVVMTSDGIIPFGMQEHIEKNAYMFITKPFDFLQMKMLTKNF